MWLCDFKSLSKAKLNRYSNFELLRVVSIFMVIFSHFFVNGGYIIKDHASFYGALINSCNIGKIGVTCFVLISGYFLIDKKFSLKKFVKLLFQIWLYGILILAVGKFTGIGIITTKYIWKSITPGFSLNWFAQAYLVLYILFPFINKLLKMISRKQLELLLLLIVVLWYVLPAFTFYEHGNERISVILIYIIGAYVRMYKPVILDNRYVQVAFVVVGSIILYIGTYLLMILGESNPIFMNHCNMLLALNSIVVLTIGLGFFLIFRDLKIESIFLVNVFSQTCFAVYLVHDNPIIKKWLWNDVLGISNVPEGYLIPYALCSAIFIYITCSLIDFVRIMFIEPKFIKFIKNFNFN